MNGPSTAHSLGRCGARLAELNDYLDGEPSDFAAPGERVAQARRAAGIERVLCTIWVGTLLGNSWDALLFRLSGGRLGQGRAT